MSLLCWECGHVISGIMCSSAVIMGKRTPSCRSRSLRFTSGSWSACRCSFPAYPWETFCRGGVFHRRQVFLLLCSWRRMFTLHDTVQHLILLYSLTKQPRMSWKTLSLKIFEDIRVLVTRKYCASYVLVRTAFTPAMHRSRVRKQALRDHLGCVHTCLV